VLAADAAAEDYTALFTDSAERLTAAIAFLHSKSAHKIGLVSHSMGARISNYFLATNGGRDVDAWVSIGISSGEFANISNLKMPVLDIYGQQDFPVVRQNAYKRAATLRALKGSAQIEVPGADHYFAGHENELAKRIGQFLDQRLR
jgi:dienelactone hydrolase